MFTLSWLHDNYVIYSGTAECQPMAAPPNVDLSEQDAEEEKK